MLQVLDATWRAAAYCWHPKALLWSLLPLLLAAGAVFGAGWLGWESAVDGVRGLLERGDLLPALFEWLEAIGAPDLRPVLAPLIVVAFEVPAVVLLTLLLLVWIAAPALARLVARRRFPELECSEHAAGPLAALGWSVLCTLMAVVALLLSMPLWLVPPLVLVLPPLIWGWLTYRVLSYDVLAEHASREERRELIRRHRMPLLAMGVLAGLLGAAPGLVWVSGGMFAALAPVLVPAAIWIYTLVFAFAALWFSHFALAALAALRLEREPPAPPPLEPPPFPPIEVLPAP